MSPIKYSFSRWPWAVHELASSTTRRPPPAFRDTLQLGSKFAIIGLFALAALTALWVGSTYMAPLCTAVLVGFTLGPLVDWCERRNVNSYLASAAIILGVSSVIGVILAAISGSVDEWTRKIPEMWERAAEEFRIIKQPLEGVNDTVDRMVEDSVPEDNVQEVKISEGGVLTQLLASLPSAGAQVVIFLGTLYFFLANRTRMRLTLLSFCMDPRARLRTARIFRDIEASLSRYVASITVVNIGLGVATGLAMAALGLPSAALWGIIAAFLNFVPYLGPLVTAVILSGVGLIVYDTLLEALLPAVVFLGLNFIEAQFVTPSVVGRALSINPLAVFLALTFWLWMWGPIGALIAVPMLIVTIVVVMHVLPQRPVARHAPQASNPAARSRSSTVAQDDRASAVEGSFETVTRAGPK